MALKKIVKDAVSAEFKCYSGESDNMNKRSGEEHFRTWASAPPSTIKSTIDN